MKYTIEILNSDHATVEEMRPTFTGAVVVTDSTGRHQERETLGEFMGNLGDIARQEVYNRPGHTAILYAPTGIPLAFFDED